MKEKESTLICDQGISNVDKEKSIKKFVFIGQQQQECSGLYKILLANKKQTKNTKSKIDIRYPYTVISQFIPEVLSASSG